MDIEYLKSVVSDTSFAENIHYFPSIDSTNIAAKDLASKIDDRYAVVIADRQTAGRGRKDRKWYSPEGEGVYASFLIKPMGDKINFFSYVMLGCLAVVNAVEKCYGEKAEIKWPNDIMISGKKCAGVLTESVLKGDAVEYVICGIGVNVNTSQFEDGYLHPPTSLFLEYGKKTKIETFAGELINSLYSCCEKLFGNESNPLFDYYRECSLCINKRVKIVDDENVIVGVAENIDENGYLFIRTPEGSLKQIVTGDLILITS